MTWNDAFEVSELYSNLKNPTDSEVDKAVRRYKKYIERMTQKFY